MQSLKQKGSFSIWELFAQSFNILIPQKALKIFKEDVIKKTVPAILSYIINILIPSNI
jgi:hypothetical protein